MITFVRNDIRNTVHVSHSVVAERSWPYLHSDLGTIAFCNWYRPPNAPEDHTTIFHEELAAIREEVIGIIVLGDLKEMVDLFQWKYSRRPSAKKHL